MTYSIYKCVNCDTIYEEEKPSCIICHYPDFFKYEYDSKSVLVLCDCGFVGYIRSKRCPKCGRDGVRRIDRKVYITRMTNKYWKDKKHLAKDKGFFDTRKQGKLKPLDDIMNLIDKSNKPVVEEMKITKEEMKFVDQVPLPKMNIQTCRCGCGKIVLSGAKFLRGHYIRKKKEV